jgi:hypothetical protein
MVDCLQGGTAPTSRLGGLLIDEPYQQAFMNLIELAAVSQAELSERHPYPIAFDQYGMAALDRIAHDLWQGGWSAQSPEFAWYVKAMGGVLACTMLQFGNSIIAFRAKDNFNNFSVYVARTQSEFFPFHKITKLLTTAASGTVCDYYQAFTAPEAAPDAAPE